MTVEAGETGLSTRKMVLEAAGYNVITAITAAQALKFLHTVPIRALLFSSDVDDVPQTEFLKKVKQTHPELPIIFLSPQPWAPDELRPYVDEVVEKMADPRVIVELLRRRFPSSGGAI